MFKLFFIYLRHKPTKLCIDSHVGDEVSVFLCLDTAGKVGVVWRSCGLDSAASPHAAITMTMDFLKGVWFALSVPGIPLPLWNQLVVWQL